jgi:hypothetical protein
MQREQVRHVPVARFRLVVVLDPLLQAPGLLADLKRSLAFQGGFQLRAKFGIGLQQAAGGNAVGKQFVDYFLGLSLKRLHRRELLAGEVRP